MSRQRESIKPLLLIITLSFTACNFDSSQKSSRETVKEKTIRTEKMANKKEENETSELEYTIPNHIIALLDKLKKPCQVIKKELFEEIETDDEDLYHVFSINNNDKVNLPKEIKRLEVYFNEYEYESSYKLLDGYGADKAENILIEDSYNIPDLLTLKKIYPSEYKVIVDYMQTLYDEKEKYSSYNAYSKLVKNYLGHDLYPSFIGGNMNQMYVELYDFKDLNFLMQYQTDWSNGEIVFVFNTKENPLDIKIMVQH